MKQLLKKLLKKISMMVCLFIIEKAEIKSALKREPGKGSWFILQCFLAIIFLGFQTNKMFESINGVSIVMFMAFYSSMHIKHSLSGLGKIVTRPLPEYTFMMNTYRIWMIVMGTLVIVLGTMLIRENFESMDVDNELKMLSGVLIGILFLLIVSKVFSIKMSNPFMGASMSAVFSVWTQLMLIPIAQTSGIEGWAPWTVWIGVVTILIRVKMIIEKMFLCQKDSMKDISLLKSYGYGNIALLCAEVAKLVSWLAFIHAFYQILLNGPSLTYLSEGPTGNLQSYNR